MAKKRLLLAIVLLGGLTAQRGYVKSRDLEWRFDWGWKIGRALVGKGQGFLGGGACAGQSLGSTRYRP